LRSRTPKHSRLQADQGPQPESSQSLSSTQGGRSEHTSNSSRRPLAGLPQWLGCTSTSRLRERKPEEHVAEQPDHGIHSPHWPSVHPFSQGCVLQGDTSPLSNGSHSRPPSEGDWAIALFRRFVPPPQVQEHPDHSSQSLHLQSVALQPAVEHGATSSRAASQPSPPRAASAVTWRLRWREPSPHSAEQEDQASQSDSLQSPGESPVEHGPTLQLDVSFSTAALQLPPRALGVSSCRSRYCWPPAQLLVQSLHAVHSPSRQSTGPPRGQPCVSASCSEHGLPSPEGASRMVRCL